MSKKFKNVLDRYKKYEEINKIIDDKIKNAKHKCLYPIKTGSYTLNDVILLYKRIGSVSSYGSIFLSQIKNNKNKFVTKIQLLSDDTYKELKLLNLITQYAIANKNIHLPLMYNNLECSYFNKNDERLPLNLRDPEYKHINSYYSTFVELANSDLCSYLYNNNKITLKKLNNAISQCFIGILSCHKLKIIHNDTHWCNFLCHKIDNSHLSCFKYIYKDLIFYIENIGLNWVIWDFGLSKTMSLFGNNDIKDDYSFLITTIFAKIKIFDDYLYDIFNVFNLYKTDYEIIKYLLKKKLLFSDKPIGNIITTIIL
jgi:hypothetical protein